MDKDGQEGVNVSTDNEFKIYFIRCQVHKNILKEEMLSVEMDLDSKSRNRFRAYFCPKCGRYYSAARIFDQKDSLTAILNNGKTVTVFRTNRPEYLLRGKSEASVNSRLRQLASFDNSFTMSKYNSLKQSMKKVANESNVNVQESIKQIQKRCEQCGSEIKRFERAFSFVDLKKEVAVPGWYCAECRKLYYHDEDLFAAVRRCTSVSKCKLRIFKDYSKHDNQEKTNQTKEVKKKSGKKSEEKKSHEEKHGKKHRKRYNLLKNEMVRLAEENGITIMQTREKDSNCPICGNKQYYHRKLYMIVPKYLEVDEWDDVDDIDYYKEPVKGYYCRYCRTISYLDEDIYEATKDCENKFEVELKAPFEPAEVDELKETGQFTKRALVALLEHRLRSGRTLFIHRGMIKCERNSHEIIDVTVEVPTISGYQKLTKINVSYCVDCNQMFTSKVEYDLCKSTKNIPAVKMRYVNKKDGSFNFDELAEESPLMLLGYSVNKSNGLTTVRRQTLLKNIIEEGLMSKWEIRQHIAFLIEMNENRWSHREAIVKWKADLDYVNQYNMENQIKGRVNELKAYGG